MSSPYSLEEQLADAAAGVRRLANDLELQTRRRDRLIRRALKNGWTHAQIAEVTETTAPLCDQVTLDNDSPRP